MRFPTIPIAALCLCSGAFAQQKLPASRLQPVTTTPKQVTIDFVTGKRIPQGSQPLAANTQTIYNNTCAWSVASYYANFASCEEVYDEGRIPSAAPGSGSPVSWDEFTFAYCTYNAASFRCEIAFADNAGGRCAGQMAQTPPTWAASSVYTELDLTPMGLPGSTANNFLGCWVVSMTNLGLCVQADGDGVFDNNPAKDLFTWAFHHQMPAQTAGPEGIFVAGDPSVAAPGSCTYNIPCGAAACGTGLSTEDSAWINGDGTPIGTSVPTNCPTGTAQYGYGTYCYWFGGWPSNPYASYYFEMKGGRSCSGGSVGAAYCTVNPSADGCLPSMGAIGMPSLGNSSQFKVTTLNAPAQRSGLQFFGISGPNSLPFSNGTLCVKAPLMRLTTKPTGGTALCDGTLSYSLSEVLAQAASAGTPLIAGSSVYQQAWIRDPNSPVGSAASNAWSYTLNP